MKKTANYLLLTIILTFLFLNHVPGQDKDDEKPSWAEDEEYIEQLRKRGYVKDGTAAFDLFINQEDKVKDSVTATSFLKEKGKPDDFYAPWKVKDLDKNTAWAEGVKGDGIGEKLYTDITGLIKDDVNKPDFKPFKINFKIINGYAQNDKFYFLNNRVKKARITIYEGAFKITLVLKERDGNLKKHISRIIELKDSPEPQVFSLNISKMLSNLTCNYCGIEFIAELEILEVYKGTKFSDTCISEFTVETN